MDISINKDILYNNQMNRIEIIVATNNDHKLKEMREILKDSNIILLSLNDANIHLKDDINEDGRNYKENSLIKALTIAELANKPIIADDSGIEISFLGHNKPGIYSKRFAQSNGGQNATNSFLVSKAKKALLNKAKFTCFLTLLNFGKKPCFFKGVMKGRISTSINGTNGFGYDPIFIPKGYEKTIAELPQNLKNSISHRYRALVKLIKFIEKKTS